MYIPIYGKLDILFGRILNGVQTEFTRQCSTITNKASIEPLVYFRFRVAASSSERPTIVLGFSNFGGSEIPSKASLDLHGFRAYMRGSRNRFTPSLHAANIRFPVSLKPARSFIIIRIAGAASATASLIRSTISFCSLSGMPKLEVMNRSEHTSELQSPMYLVCR